MIRSRGRTALRKTASIDRYVYSTDYDDDKSGRHVMGKKSG